MHNKALNYIVRGMFIVVGILFLTRTINPQNANPIFINIIGIVFILFGIYRIVSYTSKLKKYERYDKYVEDDREE